MIMDLYGPITRQPRRVLMHAVDCGSFPDGKDAADFRCTRCDHHTGWIYIARKDVRRGLPCPGCNASSGDAPDCAALTDLDDRAVAPARLSAPQGRSSKPALAAAKPEHASP